MKLTYRKNDLYKFSKTNALIIVTLCALSISKVSSAEPQLLATIGKPAVLFTPDEMAVDGSEYTYLLKKVQNKIYRISPDGKEIIDWKPNKHKLHRIKSILNSPTEYLYTLDRNCEIKPCKEVLSQWSQAGELVTSVKLPSSQTTDSKILIGNNNRFITKTANKIQIYSAAGLLTKELDGYINPAAPSEKNPFSTIQDIAINAKNELIVIDKDKKRIVPINLNGKLIRPVITDTTAIYAEDLSSSTLIYDHNGYIYRSQFHSSYNIVPPCNCIQQFDQTGKLVGKIGSTGSKLGQLYSPTKLSLSQSNNFLVFDAGNWRVQKLTSRGEGLWSVGDEHGIMINPSGFVIDTDKNLYVLDSAFHRVEKFAPNGDFINSWGSLGKDLGEFEDTTGIAIGPNNKIYIQDYVLYSGNTEQTSRVQVFSTEGVLLDNYTGSLPSFDKFGNKYSLILKENPMLYNKQYFIQKNDTEGLISELPLNMFINSYDVWTGSGEYPCNRSLAIDSQQNIYFLRCSRGIGGSPHNPTYFGSVNLIKTSFNAGTILATRPIYDGVNYYWPIRFSASLAISEHDIIYTNDNAISDYSSTISTPKLTLFNTELDPIGSYPVGSISPVQLKNSQVYVNTGLIKIYDPSSLIKAPIVTEFKKLNTKGAVRLTWQDRTIDETGFNIYRCKGIANNASLLIDYNCNDFTLIKTTKANVTSVRLPPPANFQTNDVYIYRVTALKNTEESLPLDSRPYFYY
jgi:hypothetical protein